MLRGSGMDGAAVKPFTGHISVCRRAGRRPGEDMTIRKEERPHDAIFWCSCPLRLLVVGFLPLSSPRPITFFMTRWSAQYVELLCSICLSSYDSRNSEVYQSNISFRDGQVPHAGLQGDASLAEKARSLSAYSLGSTRTFISAPL